MNPSVIYRGIFENIKIHFPVFKNNSNYKIYHSLDDYLTNQSQLKELKVCTGKNTTILSNGAHLGFLYTKEFLNDLKREIQLTSKTALNE